MCILHRFSNRFVGPSSIQVITRAGWVSSRPDRTILARSSSSLQQVTPIQVVLSSIPLRSGGNLILRPRWRLTLFQAPSNAVRIFMAQIQLSSRPRPFHWFGLVSESPFGGRWSRTQLEFIAFLARPSIDYRWQSSPRTGWALYAPRYLPGLYRESISQGVISCQWRLDPAGNTGGGLHRLVPRSVGNSDITPNIV